uniref:contractile injection system protein, VgrG/Pvc8 family n=1 Tax=Paenibacillus xylaniclasticus TaxID=588083 RepID=UPI001C3FE490
VNFRAAEGTTVGDPITVYARDDKRESVIFSGYISSIRCSMVRGVYYVDVEGLSGTGKLDTKKRSRSFQEAGMTYANVVNKVLSAYSGAGVIDHITGGKAIGAPIFQYGETDWALLKRLASHFQSVIVCDILDGKPRIHLGMPEGKSYELPDSISYTASKDLKAFNEAGGYAAGYHDTDFFSYTIETGERYAIGDEIVFRRKRMVVSEVECRMDKALLIYKYKLSRADGIRQRVLHNDKLTGISLSGKVLAVKGEKVQLHLDIDKEPPKSGYWFPFAPTTGNMMYCMPQKGTHANLYIPDVSGIGAMVIGSQRQNGDSCAKTSDPNLRYLGTEHGSEL